MTDKTAVTRASRIVTACENANRALQEVVDAAIDAEDEGPTGALRVLRVLSNFGPTTKDLLPCGDHPTEGTRLLINAANAREHLHTLYDFADVGEPDDEHAMTQRTDGDPR